MVCVQLMIGHPGFWIHWRTYTHRPWTMNIHHSPQRQYQKSLALRWFISAACQWIVDLHQAIEPIFVASTASAASVACPPALSFFACFIARWHPKSGSWPARSLSCAGYHLDINDFANFFVNGNHRRKSQHRPLKPSDHPFFRVLSNVAYFIVPGSQLSYAMTRWE